MRSIAFFIPSDIRYNVHGLDVLKKNGEDIKNDDTDVQNFRLSDDSLGHVFSNIYESEPEFYFYSV